MFVASRTTYSNLYVAVGLPLQPYTEDMFQFCEQLEMLGQPIASIAPFRQLALNLMGSGDAMNLDEFCRRFIMVDGQVDETDQNVTFFNLRYATLLLAYIFCDTAGMQEWFRHREPKRGVLTTSHFHNLYVTLFSGLAGFSLYRATGQRTYYRAAQRKLSATKALSAKCGINAIPMRRLLIAEAQSFSKDRDRAARGFDESISTFARCGMIHLEAIACERAGDYMRSRGDTYWARSYYSRSQMRYMEWGATAKAERMNREHNLQNFQFQSGDDDPASSAFTTVGATVSLRGRRRYDPATWRAIAKADLVDNQGRSCLITSITEH
jgi:hypothetical protein